MPAGLLREVALGDVAGLATNGAHNHLGLPDVLAFRFETGPPPHVFITDPSQTLTPGDTYLFTLDQLIARATNLGMFLSPLVADFLQALGRTAAASAVSVIGLLPLAVDIPQKVGPVTVPAPTIPRPKRPRLPPGPPHIRLTWRGHFMNGDAPVEEWDYSLKTTQPATPLDAATLLARAQKMVDIWVHTIALSQEAQVRLYECIYAVTDGAGKVQRFPDGSYVQGKTATNLQGQSSLPTLMPLQTALCISLGSGRPGATGRGRFFLPWQNHAVIGPDFRLTIQAVTDVANNASAFVNQVNAMGERCVVNSSKGYNSTVTSVKIGRVLDTMRSRREKVPEAYFQAPPIV